MLHTSAFLSQTKFHNLLLPARVRHCTRCLDSHKTFLRHIGLKHLQNNCTGTNSASASVLSSQQIINGLGAVKVYRRKEEEGN